MSEPGFYLTSRGMLDHPRFKPRGAFTQFEAWHGFLRIPADWAPVTRALWVCALYIVLPLMTAYIVFLRRDVAGD